MIPRSKKGGLRPRSHFSSNPPGQTEVELLAHRIEERRENRIPITFAVRKRLLKTCRRIARETNNNSKIPLANLIELRDQARKEFESQRVTRLRVVAEALGFFNQSKVYLEVLDRAVDRVTNELESDYFYFRDFAYYFTTRVSPWPWFRDAFMVYLFVILLYYVLSPVIFCVVLGDEHICPNIAGKSYGGWLTALYFASTTLSTVGYGDVAVMGDGVSDWRFFVGIVYMVASALVLVTAFTAAAEYARNPLDRMQTMGIRWLENPAKDLFLYQRLRRVKAVMFSVILVEFVALNLVGVVAARFFINASESESHQWTWIQTLYWSVQTTTTIGYGDLNMPFELRWFQVFYLVISTYFVGDALRRVGSLKDELTHIRQHYAWSQRQVSKCMLADMKALDRDTEIDQYEYVVASLLSLNKVSSDDIAVIMEKFKTLSRGNTCISLDLDSSETRRLGLSDALSVDTADILFDDG